MSRDISYLTQLPVTRSVQCVAVGFSSGAGGGIVVKFGMAPGWSDTVAFSGESAAKFFQMLLQVEAKGRLPDLDDAAEETLRLAIPAIHGYDWDALSQPGRRVQEISLVSNPDGLGVEFLVESGEQRPYWLPTTVARFLAEYLGDYREALSNRKAAA